MVVLPKSIFLALTLTAAALFSSNLAHAVFEQTSEDLDMLADALATEFDIKSPLRQAAVPLLLAPPLHHWKQSRNDFKAQVMRMMVRILKERGEVIDCPECDSWRLKIRDDHAVQMNNGPLSITELGNITKGERYKQAKAVMFIKETPAGVEAKIISLTNGRILFYRLADSTENLTKVRPYMNYSRERQRRLRGEGLSYVFIDLGLYPEAQLQVEYVEQWGSRNQHISGVSISLLNPEVALGGVYHYMFAGSSRWHASFALFYPLEAAVSSAVGGESSFTSGFVPQAAIHLTVGASYGLFLSANSKAVSFGFNFFNPLFMPFVL